MRRAMMRSIAAVAALVLVTSTIEAQGAPKKILVLDFDQTAVQGSLREIFGRDNVNVGQSIARFVAARLGAAPGVTIVRATGALPFTMDPAAAAAAGRANGADAVVAGSMMVYGSASGTAGVGGPRIGGVRLNVGRRTTAVAVSLEARLIDVASGQMIGVVPGTAQGTRSGLAIGVEVPNLIDPSGFIDMTRDDFRRTAIGQFTDSAVVQLVIGIGGMQGRIGTMGAPPAPPAPAPMASGAPPSPPSPPSPSGPVTYPSGPFAYAPWQFRGTEHFRYTVTGSENRRPAQNGFYTFDLTPAGGGAVRMAVAGQLGTDQWSSTVTLQPGQTQGAGAMMAFMPLMSMGPLAVTLFNPASFMIYGGRQMAIGDGWSNSSDGETLSIRVEAQCAYAGQGGFNVIMRKNNTVASESCIAPGVALPLRSLVVSEDGDRYELVLTEYRP